MKQACHRIEEEQDRMHKEDGDLFHDYDELTNQYTNQIKGVRDFLCVCFHGFFCLKKGSKNGTQSTMNDCGQKQHFIILILTFLVLKLMQ